MQKPGLRGPSVAATPKKVEEPLKNEAVVEPLQPPVKDEMVEPPQPEPKLEPEPTPVLPPAHKVVAASEEILDLQRKLMEKEKANTDLEEKLNVLKQKRIADLAKLKEVDKLKLQNEQVRYCKHFRIWIMIYDL